MRHLTLLHIQPIECHSTCGTDYLTQGCEVGDDALRHAIFKAARAHVSERESRAWMLIALVTAFGAFSSISIGLHGHSLTHELVMYGGMVLMWTLVPALNLLVPPNYSTPRTRRLKKPVVSDELFAVLTTALMGVALVLVSPSLLLLLTIPTATALLSWQLLALMEAADETCESEATCVTPSRAPALANMNLWRTPSPELVPPKQSNHEYDTDLMMLGSVLFATASGIGLVALAQQPDLGSFNTHEQQYNFFHLGMPGFAPHGSPLASRFIWPNIWLAHVYA